MAHEFHVDVDDEGRRLVLLTWGTLTLEEAEEIAQTLGRSVGTIKAHLSHATHKLMNLLGPYLEKS